MRQTTRQPGRRQSRAAQPGSFAGRSRHTRTPAVPQKHRRLLPIALVTCAALLCLVAWPFTLAHLQAIAILRQVSNQPVPWIVGEVGANPITIEDTSVETATGTLRGRLYLPVNKPNAPAMVLFHGVHHLGIDEPRLESFAAAMASCGLRILTPELPGIKDYHVDATSIRIIGESTQWFARKTGAPVAVMGLSFSGGLALLAAADPTFQPDFKLILTVGSQDSMEHVARYYLTGREQRPNGSVETLAPHEYGALVLEYAHLEDFVPPADIDPIRKVLRQHLYEDKPAETAALAQLTPQQAAEAKQLMDSNSPATRALLARSDAAHAADMNHLSPTGKLGTMTTPVYLLHGEADTIIPAAETLWLARELPPSALKALLISPVLSHLDIDTAQPGLLDEWRLIYFFARVLHAAEVT